MIDLSLHRLATLVATPSAKKQLSNCDPHNFGSNHLPENYLWDATDFRFWIEQLVLLDSFRVAIYSLLNRKW
jgi:hypothetical protein